MLRPNLRYQDEVNPDCRTYLLRWNEVIADTLLPTKTPILRIQKVRSSEEQAKQKNEQRNSANPTPNVPKPLTSYYVSLFAPLQAHPALHMPTHP
jgi:hypothetical protein